MYEPTPHTHTASILDDGTQSANAHRYTMAVYRRRRRRPPDSHNAHAEKICGFRSGRRCVMPLSENNRFMFGSARWSTSSWWFDRLNAQRTLSGCIFRAYCGACLATNTKYEIRIWMCCTHSTTMPKHEVLLFMDFLFWILLHCAVCVRHSCEAEEHQCEFLLDIITHYYLLEYDFLILLLSFFFFLLHQLARTVARFFCLVSTVLFLFFHSCYCFVSLIGAPTASADWFDREQVAEERWNYILFFWRVMVLNEHFISNSNYISIWNLVQFFFFLLPLCLFPFRASILFTWEKLNFIFFAWTKICIKIPLRRLSRQFLIFLFFFSQAASNTEIRVREVDERADDDERMCVWELEILLTICHLQ